MKEALDSARAALRGGAGRGHDRLARDLRRDARPADDAGTRGVRGGEDARAIAFRPAPRADGASSATGRLSGVELHAGALGVRRRTDASRPSTTTADRTTLEADACILAIGQQADLSFLTAGRRRRPDPGRHDPGRPRDARDLGARRLRGRRRRLRPAQPDRGGRQRQARGAVDPRVPRRAKRRESSTTLEIEKIPTARLPDDRGLRDLRPRVAADARRRRGAPASPRWRPATATPRRARRQRAVSSATSRRSTTRRSACSATGAWTSAPSTASRIVPFDELDLPTTSGPRSSRARGGERAAPLRHGQGRRPLHPLRPLRRPLPHRRDDDGAVHR